MELLVRVRVGVGVKVTVRVGVSVGQAGHETVSWRLEPPVWLPW